MDAYEIRLELLKLAQSLVAEQGWITRNKLEQDWAAARDIAIAARTEIPPFPDMPEPTVYDIIETAEELNKFISNNKKEQSC